MSQRQVRLPSARQQTTRSAVSLCHHCCARAAFAVVGYCRILNRNESNASDARIFARVIPQTAIKVRITASQFANLSCSVFRGRTISGQDDVTHLSREPYRSNYLVRLGHLCCLLSQRSLRAASPLMTSRWRRSTSAIRGRTLPPMTSPLPADISRTDHEIGEVRFASPPVVLKRYGIAPIGARNEHCCWKNSLQSSNFEPHSYDDL
jgi:hypothetical protein